MNKMPIAGIRVADLTTGLAGPFVTQLLTWLGAEVIKIESMEHTSLLRQTAEARFINTNLAKLSITVNLNRPEGLELVKRIIAVSDVLAESYRPGVVGKLGLDYESVRRIKPDIIMLSLSGFGQTPPEGHYRTWASIFGGMGGLTHLTGYPDGIPANERGANDTRGGQHAAFTLLAALNYRQRTGRGQFLDLSVRDAVCCHIGDVLMDYTMNHRDPGRRGNRDDIMAPHNCYRCRGEDKWVSIAVASDEEWRALCRGIDQPELAGDRRFAEARMRWRNQDELDRIIAVWTLEHTHYEVMQILQEAGVAAVPSFNCEEIYTDRHFKERGFIRDIEHPERGKQAVTGPPWRMSATVAKIDTSPTMGQHNDYVFGTLLGMSASEITELTEGKVIY
ncbi:MAG: CoA transferase [Dehalococcoidia bacterium]|nr:MAG: CoA transferase [Dehalococcoidia bacterium]